MIVVVSILAPDWISYCPARGEYTLFFLFCSNSPRQIRSKGVSLTMYPEGKNIISIDSVTESIWINVLMRV